MYEIEWRVLILGFLEETNFKRQYALNPFPFSLEKVLQFYWTHFFPSKLFFTNELEARIEKLQGKASIDLFVP